MKTKQAKQIIIDLNIVCFLVREIDLNVIRSCFSIDIQVTKIRKHMATMTINSSIFKPIIMKILKTMTNKASSAKTKRFHDFIFILVMYKMLKQPLNDNDIQIL